MSDPYTEVSNVRDKDSSSIGIHRCSSHDIEKVSEIYHPDAVYVTPDGETHKTRDYVEEVIRKFGSAFPDLKIKIQHHHVPSDTVSIIEYTFSGTHTGKFKGSILRGRP
jgi:hypothetical protein